MSVIVRPLKHDIAKGVGEYVCVNWEDEYGKEHHGIDLLTLYFFDDWCYTENDVVAAIGAIFRERWNYDRYLRGKWPGAYHIFNQQEDTWIAAN